MMIHFQMVVKSKSYTRFYSVFLCAEVDLLSAGAELISAGADLISAGAELTVMFLFVVCLFSRWIWPVRRCVSLCRSSHLVRSTSRLEESRLSNSIGLSW